MTSACSRVASTGLMAEGLINLAACQSCTKTSPKVPLPRKGEKGTDLFSLCFFSLLDGDWSPGWPT